MSEPSGITLYNSSAAATGTAQKLGDEGARFNFHDPRPIGVVGTKHASDEIKVQVSIGGTWAAFWDSTLFSGLTITEFSFEINAPFDQIRVVKTGTHGTAVVKMV